MRHLLRRHKLEQSSITKPAMANERLSIDDTGHIVLKLKTPCRDGTTQSSGAGLRPMLTGLIAHRALISGSAP